MGVVVGRELAHRIGIEAEHGMEAERRCDLRGLRRRPGVETEMPVMAAPFDDLEPVD